MKENRTTCSEAIEQPEHRGLGAEGVHTPCGQSVVRLCVHTVWSECAHTMPAADSLV